LRQVKYFIYDEIQKSIFLSLRPSRFVYFFIFINGVDSATIVCKFSLPLYFLPNIFYLVIIFSKISLPWIFVFTPSFYSLLSNEFVFSLTNFFVLCWTPSRRFAIVPVRITFFCLFIAFSSIFLFMNLLIFSLSSSNIDTPFSFSYFHYCGFNIFLDPLPFSLLKDTMLAASKVLSFEQSSLR
jgi:hypothetical protein